jgi:predicted RecB family nuclease
MKIPNFNRTKDPDIDQLYIACLTQEEKDRITARTVYDYCISPFMVYCEKFAPPDKKDPLTEFDQLLMEEGKNHENQVLKEKYPGLKKAQFETLEEGFKLVLEAMKRGSNAISGAPIFYLPQGLTGIVDVLEKRTNAPSFFGKYHYIVKEIKLAKNIKNYHIFQGAFYNYLIGKIQGFTPSSFYLINRDHEEFENAYDERALLETITDIRMILNGKKVSPTYGACKAPWETYNDEEAIRLRDVSLVSGCGPSFKKRFLEKGVGTFDELAKTSKDKLLQIKGIGDKTAIKFLQNSNALVQGKHVCIGTCPSFPKKSTEIFLDLEGTGEQVGEEELIAMDYLIGVLLRKDGKTEYMPFLAEDIDKEEQMFNDFVNWVGKQKDFIIYHWHNYERVHLQKLAQRYNLQQSKFEFIFSNMRDLYKDATSTFAFPTYGNGLKEIAPYIGYKWKHEEVNAKESVAIYLQYIKDKIGNKEKMQKVIDYNTDDCEATLLIKDWLEKELNMVT